MASMLLSRSNMIRFFSGFKHFLAPSREITRIPKLQAPLVNLSILSAVQNTAVAAPQATKNLDRVLYKIDSEIRRTGRISKKEIDDVFGELKDLKYASSTQSLLLLRCLGSLLTEELPEVRNKLVQEIWDTLIKFNVPLDISHYNSLLRVYIENGHDFSPIEFLSSLENAGIEPNRVTYQRLITRYCHEGDIEGASKILEFMKEKELPVNENVFNALIMGHARANDMESAHGVLSVMKTSGLTPSPESYQMLLSGYAEKGDIVGLEKVMEECESSDIQLQNREFMEVIYALASKGHSQHVSMFIEKLQKIFGYQQDVMNLIYRLINVGCDEVAYQMFETMSLPQNSEGETSPVGSFFLKQLIKSELYSVVTIVEYCQKMKREGLNLFSMEKSLYAALSLGRPELSIALMRVMMEDGLPLRTHYFWPILVHFAKLGDEEKIYKTIGDMASMDVPITLETCRNYIMPALLKKHRDEEPVILALKEAGIVVPLAINGCIAYYLDEKDIVSAAQLLSRYKVRVHQAMRRDLSDAYIQSKEATAAVATLRQMIVDNQKKDVSTEDGESGVEGQDEGKPLPSDVTGLFLKDILNSTGHATVLSYVEPLLQAMKVQGIGISKNISAEIQAKLGDKLTDEVINLLQDLSSGELTLQPLSRDSKFAGSQSIEQLEHRVTELEIKNLPTQYLLVQLLGNYIRMKNIDKAEEVKQKLVAMEYPLNAGLYVLLIDMYASDGQLEKAVDLYKELRTKVPDSKISPAKLLRFATAMISQGLIEESLKILEENAPESVGSEGNQGMVLSAMCGNFLNTAIQKANCSDETLQRLFDSLIQFNYTKPVGNVCSPLVKIHLVNDNLTEAMNVFEKLCITHKVTPLKHELTLACIKVEDTEKLQKIMDLSIGVHGEMNSLYDLVFAFIECGKIRQARKILETPGLRARSQRLEGRCKILMEQSRISELENLVTITKDVFDVDRNIMYTCLLEAYRRQADCDKALGIWTTMQEENIEPSESFLRQLGQLLMDNGREVPFVMPKPAKIPVTPEATVTPTPAKTQKASPKVTPVPESPKSSFAKAIKASNMDTAMQEKKKLEESGVQLSVTDNSKLIEGLVREDRLEEACKIAKEMVVAGQYPVPRIFKFLFTRLSTKGDIDAITSFDSHLDNTLRRSVMYDTRLCRAYINSGRSEEYLDNLSSLVSESNVDTDSIRSKFPVGGIMGILEEKKELLPKVMSIVEKFSSHSITTPANCVWMHHFGEGNHAEAKEIYDKYLAESKQTLLFNSITHKARQGGTVEMLPPLMEVLNSIPTTTPAAKGLVYSCWLDVLCASGKYDEAQGVLEGSLKAVSLEDFNRTALKRVKEGLALSNKSFPYTIPATVKKDRQSRSSSSSSSSDSDRKP